MPFVKVVTSVKLEEAKRDAVRDAVWEAITLLPNKTPEVTMVEIQDGADLFKGPGGTPALFCETRVFTTPPMATKKAYAEAFFAKMSELLGTKKENMYLNILAFNEWGGGGSYNAL